MVRHAAIIDAHRTQRVPIMTALAQIKQFCRYYATLRIRRGGPANAYMNDEIPF